MISTSSIAQVLGLPHRERQSLQHALEKIGSATQTGLAALVTEGWYMAATPEWWMLHPSEQLLLQHIAAHAPEVSSCTLNRRVNDYKVIGPFTLEVGKSVDAVPVSPIISANLQSSGHSLYLGGPPTSASLAG